MVKHTEQTKVSKTEARFIMTDDEIARELAVKIIRSMPIASLRSIFHLEKNEQDSQTLFRTTLFTQI